MYTFFRLIIYTGQVGGSSSLNTIGKLVEKFHLYICIVGLVHILIDSNWMNEREGNLSFQHIRGVVYG